MASVQEVECGSCDLMAPRWSLGMCWWHQMAPKAMQCPADALQAYNLPSVSLSPLLTQLLVVLPRTPALHPWPLPSGCGAPPPMHPWQVCSLFSRRLHWPPGDAQVPLMGQWPDGAGSLEAAFSHRPQRLAERCPLIDWPSQGLPQFAPNTSPLWGQRPKEKLGTHA